jgi:hypothetical protein
LNNRIVREKIILKKQALSPDSQSLGKRRREKYFIAKHDCQLNYLRASSFPYVSFLERRADGGLGIFRTSDNLPLYKKGRL